MLLKIYYQTDDEFFEKKKLLNWKLFLKVHIVNRYFIGAYKRTKFLKAGIKKYND